MGRTKTKVNSGKAPNGTVVVRVEPLTKRRKPGSGKPFSKDYNPKPFPKGVSGNPGGRPKGMGMRRISDAYNGVLGQPVPQKTLEDLGIEVEVEVTWADLIAIQMARKAVEVDGAKVNFTAVTELRETTEGKTPEKAEVSGKDGAPLASPTFAVNFLKSDFELEQERKQQQGEQHEPDQEVSQSA